VDDITQKMTQCELLIPMGNSTVMVAHSIVSPVDPNKTPRSHGDPISPGYYSVSVDRVVKDYREVALDYPRGDDEKTLGQAEHSFIIWHKRYIIIPEARLGYCRLIGVDKSERKSFSIIILNYWLLA
jgi:hypothetical protein